MKRTTEQIKAQHVAARAEMDEFGPEPYYLGVLGALDWLLGVADTSPITGLSGLAANSASLRTEYEAEAQMLARPEHLRPASRSDGWLNGAAEVLGWAIGINGRPLPSAADELRPIEELRGEMMRLVVSVESRADVISPNERDAVAGAAAALKWLVGEAPAPLTSLPPKAEVPSVDDVVSQLELLNDQRDAFNCGAAVVWSAHMVGVEKALVWALDDSGQPIAV